MTSVAAPFLDNATFSTGSYCTLAVTLAPLSIVTAMGANPDAYCPLHSLMNGLSAPLAQARPPLTFDFMRISGYDLPLPTAPLPVSCAVLDCAAMGGCRRHTFRSLFLSTEPIMLQRSLMRWLRDIQPEQTST